MRIGSKTGKKCNHMIKGLRINSILFQLRDLILVPLIEMLLCPQAKTRIREGIKRGSLLVTLMTISKLAKSTTQITCRTFLKHSNTISRCWIRISQSTDCLDLWCSLRLSSFHLMCWSFQLWLRIQTSSSNFSLTQRLLWALWTDWPSSGTLKIKAADIGVS